jgi:membrane protease YdiL (CAAX protease family)
MRKGIYREQEDIYNVVGFFFSIAVTLIDAFLHPNYFVKIPIKIVFFLALPMLFFVKNKEAFSDFKKLFVFKKSGILKALLLGIGVYAVIVGGFLLTRNIIDYSNVTSNLTDGMGITADNFLYVSLYISLMNSFLEEFFFRGFGFITLKKYSNRKLAYIFSSLLFAIYHVGMLVGMFEFWALLLLLFGLIIGGCIFNFLNELNDNVYPSWFVHMFANFAINTVGFILFGIL